MPSVPKWLADTLEKVANKSYHPVTVTHTHYYTPNLKLVRFEGDINHSSFVAGNVVEFRVSERDFRHYTPSRYNVSRHLCEVIFYLHRQGAGSHWAESLAVGDEVKLLGPGGRLAYQTDWPRHFAFGDETSLGLLLCLAEAAQQRGHRFFGLAELAADHQHWPQQVGGAQVQAVPSSTGQPAQPALDALNQWDADFWINAVNTCFYLTGRTKSIQQLRKFLLAKGINTRQIKTDPYWAEGKQGL